MFLFFILFALVLLICLSVCENIDSVLKGVWFSPGVKRTKFGEGLGVSRGHCRL